jgi:hypothetical protein
MARQKADAAKAKEQVVKGDEMGWAVLHNRCVKLLAHAGGTLPGGTARHTWMELCTCMKQPTARPGPQVLKTKDARRDLVQMARTVRLEGTVHAVGRRAACVAATGHTGVPDRQPGTRGLCGPARPPHRPNIRTRHHT